MDSPRPQAPSSRPARWSVPHRFTCGPCQVAWTGTAESRCWICDGPGDAGPPPLFTSAAA